MTDLAGDNIEQKRLITHALRCAYEPPAEGSGAPQGWSAVAHLVMYWLAHPESIPTPTASRTVELTATWRKKYVGGAGNQEEELWIGGEWLGSVWKVAIGDNWAYTCRSFISPMESPTRETAKAALIAALKVT